MYNTIVVIASMRDGRVQTSTIVADNIIEAITIAMRMPEFKNYHTMSAIEEYKTDEIMRELKCAKENAHQAELLYR